MIFSELKLRNSNDRAYRELANRMIESPYLQHQELWKLFNLPKGSAAPFVFRESIGAAAPTFWMQSSFVPTDENNIWSIRHREFSPKFSAGDLLEFEVRANPTFSESIASASQGNTKRQRGKRGGLIGSLLQNIAAEQRRHARAEMVNERLPLWLSERGKQNGFELHMDEQGQTQCIANHHTRWKFKGKKGEPITLAVAEFNGVLRVTDANAFSTCVQKGLGRAKRFGLGMWMLKRFYE